MDPVEKVFIAIATVGYLIYCLLLFQFTSLTTLPGGIYHIVFVVYSLPYFGGVILIAGLLKIGEVRGHD